MDPQHTPIDFSEQINQRNIKNTNKTIYKLRAKDPDDSKKTLTYFLTKIEKFNSYVEFTGFLTSCINKNNVETYEELTELAKKNGLEEVIMTKPWQQIVDITVIRKTKEKEK